MNQLTLRLERHMDFLCKQCGSKHCGSFELERAGRYIEQYIQSLGIHVHREEFDAPGWQLHSFRLLDETTGISVPGATACYYSQSVDITDVPVWLESKDLEQLDSGKISGRLCFVASWGKGATATRYYNEIAEKLDAAGAAGAIFISYGQTDLSPNTKIQRNPFLKHLGTAAVAQAGALYIANHRSHQYTLSIKAECFSARLFNVVATIGNGLKQAIVGAHYDTAPLIEGAADNAGGASVLMEFARLAKDRVPDDWTIRFVAFSAEEIVLNQLPLGSGDFVRRHEQEGIRWMINIDGPAAYFDIPKMYLGHEEKLPPLHFPYEAIKTDYCGDDKAFGLAGIPSVWIFKRRIFGERHTAEDNLSCIDFQAMRRITEHYLDLFEQLIHC